MKLFHGSFGFSKESLKFSIFFQPSSFLHIEGFDLLSSIESTESSQELGRVYRVLSSYSEFQSIPCLSRIWCRYRNGLGRVSYESIESYRIRPNF